MIAPVMDRLLEAQLSDHKCEIICYFDFTGLIVPGQS